jgi:hypothetical protein
MSRGRAASRTPGRFPRPGPIEPTAGELAALVADLGRSLTTSTGGFGVIEGQDKSGGAPD